MKKSLLIAGAVFAFASAMNAQEVTYVPTVQHDNLQAQNIPGTLDNNLCRTTVLVASNAETEAKPILAPWKNDETYNIFGDDHSGDYIEFLLHSDEASYYIINFQTGTKNAGAQLLVSLYDGNTASESSLIWSTTVDVPNNMEWNSKWATPFALVDKEIPAGDHLFKVEFYIEAEKANVANIYDIAFQASAVAPATYNIFPEVYEQIGEDLENNDEVGTITISPSAESYVTGTEVIFTVAPAEGYKFLYLEINGEKTTTVPYTLTIEDEDLDVIAVFEEINMYNNVPGTINLDTRQNVVTENGDKEPVQTGNIKLDGETVTDANYIGNFRNGGHVSFALNVTEAGEYDLTYYAATKNPYETIPASNTFSFAKEGDSENAAVYGPFEAPVTGGWTNMEKVAPTQKIALEAGKYLMTISFAGDKDTVNMYGINLALNGNTGNDPSAVETIEVVEGSVKAYNLQGVEVDPETEGLIIVNGKKVINRK